MGVSYRYPLPILLKKTHLYPLALFLEPLRMKLSPLLISVTAHIAIALPLLLFNPSVSIVNEQREYGYTSIEWVNLPHKHRYGCEGRQPPPILSKYEQYVRSVVEPELHPKDIKRSRPKPKLQPAIVKRVHNHPKPQEVILPPLREAWSP